MLERGAFIRAYIFKGPGWLYNTKAHVKKEKHVRERYALTIQVL
jgi:hypothetical protein